MARRKAGHIQQSRELAELRAAEAAGKFGTIETAKAGKAGIGGGAVALIASAVITGILLRVADAIVDKLKNRD